MKLVSKKFKVFFYLLLVFFITSETFLFSKGAFARNSASEESEVNKKLERKKFIDKVTQLYDFIDKSYYIDPNAVDSLDGTLKGMLENLGDPYSTYVTKEESEKYQESITGEFGGLGITIDEGLDIESGIHYIRVIAPIEGTPAYFAGIQTGDLIISVNEISTAEMSANDAVRIMRGEPGSSVVITVKRDTSIFPVTIIRDIIKVIYLKHAKITKDIAYISLLSFNDNTPERFKTVLQELEEEKYTHLIIDLRDNPGGSLAAVLKIADFFLEKETLIVGTDSRIESSRQQYLSRTESLVPYDKKIVILINGGSASASEILAGALKYNGRAVLVGKDTYGKGLVQTIQPFGDGFITLTVAEYYTPGENYINEIGISPDIKIEGINFSDNIQERIWFSKIVNENLVRNFVEEKLGKIRKKEIEEFKQRLKKMNMEFKDFRIISHLLVQQANIFNDVINVYNLETDIVLTETVSLIKKGDI